MTHDPVIAELKIQISMKKARYAKLRHQGRQLDNQAPIEYQEMSLLLQEIGYLELCFRRDPGVAAFLKEPDTDKRTTLK